VSSGGVGAVSAGVRMHLSEEAVGGGVPPPAGIAVQADGGVASLEHRLAHSRRIEPPGSRSSVAAVYQALSS
jgi:hypothetical protein